MERRGISCEHEQWKVGPDGMQLGEIHIASIKQADDGWEVLLVHKPIRSQ